MDEMLYYVSCEGVVCVRDPKAEADFLADTLIKEGKDMVVIGVLTPIELRTKNGTEKIGEFPQKTAFGCEKEIREIHDMVSALLASRVEEIRKQREEQNEKTLPDAATILEEDGAELEITATELSELCKR